MAIKKVTSWIYNRAGVQARDVPKGLASLIIELNPVLHEAAARFFGYSEGITKSKYTYGDPRIMSLYFAEVTAILMNIIARMPPTEMLVLVVDGVPPVAKMTQQRARRFAASKIVVDKDDVVIFNSNMISPGTEMMIEFDLYFKDWLVSHRRDLPFEVIYSGHIEDGEGEHKIMDMFRKGAIPEVGPHVIFGADSDLYMLGLVINAKHIYNARFNHNNKSQIDYVSIDTLKEFLQTELGKPTAISDFVFLMYLWGNDFLPHQCCFSNLDQTIEATFEAYHKTSIGLTDLSSGELVLEGVASFLSNLAETEPTLLAETAARTYKYPLQSMVESMRKRADEEGNVMIDFDVPKFRSSWYTTMLVPFDSETYRFNIDEEMLDQMITEACASYFLMLKWIFKYYTKGMKECNYDLFYPYHYAPLISDLSAVVSAYLENPEIENELTNGDKHTFKKVEIFHPVAQLSCVLPSKDYYLVDELFQPLIENPQETGTNVSGMSIYQPESWISVRYNTDDEHDEIHQIGFFDPSHVRFCFNSFIQTKLESENFGSIVARYEPDDFKLDNLGENRPKLARAPRSRQEPSTKLDTKKVEDNSKMYADVRKTQFKNMFIELEMPKVKSVLIIDGVGKSDLPDIIDVLFLRDPEIKVNVYSLSGRVKLDDNRVTILSDINNLKDSHDLVIVNDAMVLFSDPRPLLALVHKITSSYVLIRDHSLPEDESQAVSYKAFIELEAYLQSAFRGGKTQVEPHLFTPTQLKDLATGFIHLSSTKVDPKRPKHKYSVLFIKDTDVILKSNPLRISTSIIRPGRRFSQIDETQLKFISRLLVRNAQNDPEIGIKVITDGKNSLNDLAFINKLLISSTPTRGRGTGRGRGRGASSRGTGRSDTPSRSETSSRGTGRGASRSETTGRGRGRGEASNRGRGRGRGRENK